MTVEKDKRRMPSTPDFKGLRHSKIGYFKEFRSKIKELEKLNIQLAQRHNRLDAIFNSMSDGVTILDRGLNIVFTNRIQKNVSGNFEFGKELPPNFLPARSAVPRLPGDENLEDR